MNTSVHVTEPAGRLPAVVSYINRYLHQPLPVSTLADEACMSEATFYRMFKQAVGQTPVDYINQQRIERAIELLRTTNDTLRSISNACGFNSLPYFCRIFRRQVGIPPAQYRRALN